MIFLDSQIEEKITEYKRLNVAVDSRLIELIRGKQELPVNTEIQDKTTGEYDLLSDTARMAANRRSCIYDISPTWVWCWRDLWPRLRINE